MVGKQLRRELEPAPPGAGAVMEDGDGGGPEGLEGLLVRGAMVELEGKD